MKGKLIVIEGTDCSGKETQSKLLESKLNELGYKTKRLYFPNYESPTGKIIGGCYLGIKDICEEYLKTDDGWFEEGASNVDPLVATLYYAADRRYNIKYINELLDSGINVILDRYLYSNMAHHGSKLRKKEDRNKLINKLEILEFDILELPKPDAIYLLYVPFKISNELKKNRKTIDQHEKDTEYLKRTEKVYLELVDRFKIKKINCVKKEQMRSKEEISLELLKKVLGVINEKI